MARIRTIKPDLFRHEALFEIEKKTKLPIRVAWMGLFTVADREGRFEWRPNILKLDILPWDAVDFSQVLEALVGAGFIKKYFAQGKTYGWIINFSKHQRVKSDEARSQIPEPPASDNDPIGSEPNPTPVQVEPEPAQTQIRVVELELELERELERNSVREKIEISPPMKVPIVSDTKSLKPSSRGDPLLKRAEAGKKARTFIGRYVKAYQSKFPEGRPEDLNDGKTQGQIFNWIKEYPLDRACQLVEVYFQMDCHWFGTKGYDFLTFRNNLNKIGQALDSGKDPDGKSIDWAKIKMEVGAT